jgi:NTP pyrophosphatase (non-canonical NTP hydrolase)
MSENWQSRATEFAQKHNLLHPPGVFALDLASEVGEVAKEILLATDYGQQPFQPQPTLASELGDVLYSLCLLASSAGVDLETALENALAKYEQRLERSDYR